MYHRANQATITPRDLHRDDAADLPAALIFRRTSTNPVVNFTFAGQSGRNGLTGINDATSNFVGVPVTNGFINAPLNYALLRTSGIDADLSYNHLFENGVRVSYRGLLSWVQRRLRYTSVSEPNRSRRLHGGWAIQFGGAASR